MRAVIIALSLPLAACGGAGGNVSSIGSSAPAGAVISLTPTPTPTQTPNSTQTNLFDVSTATKFDAVGAVHSLAVNADGSSLYQGNASTVEAPSGTISYDPRDGVFVMTIADNKANVSRNITFQDPGHRTTADANNVERQVPLLAGFNYLNVLDGTVPLTFFYKRPNSSGSFVSLAGFERSQASEDGSSLAEQGVLVFGTRSTTTQTPTKGAAHFDGQFLATTIAQQGNSARVQQWLEGISAVEVDFAKRTLSLSLSGKVGPAFVQNKPVADSALSVPSGSTFTAAGSAGWTSASTVFSGKFASAAFSSNGTSTPIDFTSVSAGTATAGASSIDGTFYGPDAKNVGGNFRIVGGIPNQRVDILGGFIGAKKQ